MLTVTQWQAPPPPPAGTPPTITTTSLPNGAVGTAYSYALTATGTAPVTWSVTVGALPAGLTLAANGVISGTPTAVGTFDFTVRAANNHGHSVRALSLTISAAADPAPGPGGGADTHDSPSEGNDEAAAAPPSNINVQALPDMPAVATVRVPVRVTNGTAFFTVTHRMVSDAVAAANERNTGSGIAVNFVLSGTGFESISGTFERRALQALNQGALIYMQVSSEVIDISLGRRAISETITQTAGNVSLAAMREHRMSDSALRACLKSFQQHRQKRQLHYI